MVIFHGFFVNVYQRVISTVASSSKSWPHLKRYLKKRSFRLHTRGLFHNPGETMWNLDFCRSRVSHFSMCSSPFLFFWQSRNSWWNPCVWWFHHVTSSHLSFLWVESLFFFVKIHIGGGWMMKQIPTYWCLVGNGWEWGNGIVITSDCGSFPHSLLSTSKKIDGKVQMCHGDISGEFPRGRCRGWGREFFELGKSEISEIRSPQTDRSW